MFSKIKKAFGFGGSDDELIADDPDIRTTDRSPFNITRDTSDDISTGDMENTAHRIFDHVVTEFNKALPGFLADSVDPERQKAALYEGLSADLKAHLAALENSVTKRLDDQWRTEREKLQSDLKNISDTAKEIEAKRAELKTQQLSSDRQRRALTERVRDLEKQILGLEADKEQLELEIKSMLNKVKVASVYEKDCEAMREQIAHLQSELNKKRVSGQAAPAEPSVSDEEVERLRKIEVEYNDMAGKMNQVEEQMNKVEEVIAAKDSRLKTLTDEVGDLKKALDESRLALGESQSALENAQNELGRTRTALEKAQADYAESDTKLARMRKERDEAVAEARNAAQKTETAASSTGSGRRTALPDDDDILTDTDWIVGPSSHRAKGAGRSERSKQKKNTPRDDGQMSLW